MAMQVCMGASMMCSFGAAPSSLVVLPINKNLHRPGAGRQHHGPYTDGEYHAVRHVLVNSQPGKWRRLRPPLWEY